MKIGTRLTAWGTLITLATCTVVCTTLYVGLSISLHREVDSFLEGEVQEFLAILMEEGHGGLDAIEADIRRELGSRARNDLTFRLLDLNGNLILASHIDPKLPDPWDLNGKGQRESEVWFDTVRPSGASHSTRACSTIATLPRRGKYIVQATYSLVGVNANLYEFMRFGMIVLTVSLVLSLLGGRFFARKSLQPIQRMTESAGAINANNLSARLNQSGNADEIDQLAQVLNDMLERLERQVQRIRQFTADAAHELRTPIAALRGNAEIALGEGADSNRRREALEESIEEYDRLSRLTEDLLSLARADAGQLLSVRQDVNLAKSLEDVIDLYSALAEERGVELACSAETDVTVNADPGRVRQVLSNVLDNALKFTQPGGHVRASLTASQGKAVLTVVDTGIGIEQENIPKLFDRFYRADKARSRESSGSGGNAGFGLGLPICRSIMSAHGGTISLASKPGQGTTVVLEFPMQ
ncbi:MAG: heavy metal sensor histidine kinase [Phycisphaerae bacterium]|nr:heavy metal sensor histidine kinase [Phycisphaerales bacterium]